ncbi:MAG: pantothenate kinase [Cyanobacteria bacterium J06623_7]
MDKELNWLALAIGNSRSHWAWFEGHTLVATWDTNHLTTPVTANRLPEKFLHPQLIDQNLLQITVYLASVVQLQTQYWQAYQHLTEVTLNNISLTNIYPSLGIDRALTVAGAIATYNQSCLVIDGGTALTFTGATKNRRLIGGAILPGLRLQLLSLQQKTSALPEIVLPSCLPPRWALDTDMAISSGVLYTAISSIHGFISDWLKQFPASRIIFTGGDGTLLATLVLQQDPSLGDRLIIEPNLIFQGLKSVYLSEQI